MTDVKKFLFDTKSFDDVKPAIYTDEQVELARTQGFEKGKAEGLAEAGQRQEEQIATVLQKALTQVEKLVKNEDRREMEKCADAAKLTLRAMSKLLPAFADKYALPEIERVIAQSIETRRDEPRLAVTLPAAHLEALSARVDAIAAGKGFAGKVILLADDAMPATDCRVEWADGGAERLYTRLLAQIETEFTKAIDGMNAVATTTKGEKKS